MERKFRIGDTVMLKVDCLGNRAGTRGVVYEEYDLGDGPGASIIFQNGNYDGFSPDDLERWTEKTGHCFLCSRYQFQNVIKLEQHFRGGYFDEAFSPEDGFEQARRTAGGKDESCGL